MHLPSKGIVCCTLGLVAAVDAFMPIPPSRTHRYRPLVRPLPAWAPLEGGSGTQITIRALSPPRRKRSFTDVPTLDINVIDPYTGASGVHFQEVSDLLSKEDEVALARLVQQRMLWDTVRCSLASELQREPTTSEWAASCGRGGSWLDEEEFSRAVRDGDAAKAALISANLRLVIYVARRHKAQLGSRLPLSDLVQEGTLGLVKAVEKFDPERGFRFSTYSVFWIRQNITRAVLNHGRTIRLPVHVQDLLTKTRRTAYELAAELGRAASKKEVADRLGVTVDKLRWLYACQQNEPISLSVQHHTAAIRPDNKNEKRNIGDTVHCDVIVTPEDYTNFRAMQEDVDNFLRSLLPRDRIVLRMRYGLDNGGRGESVESVATHLGICKQRVRQIESRALKRLRLLSARGDAIAEAARAHVA
eukprot:TRINITY_DN286_c1_g2_i1.p1 TRINITY_DN286_c1_g2~~TRINITY_DN286_c1_g2_i1.p1  ORF type:complete len:417 (+),score=129.73 TRINITY_DN286_c1_g2_i1:186-1436(+)